MQMFSLYPVRWYEQLLLNQRDVVGMNDLVLYINDCAVSICTAASAIERLYSILYVLMDVLDYCSCLRYSRIQH